MSHNLETTASGETAMFCVGDRKAAWHWLGQRSLDAVTWKEAMRLAHLEWTVSKHAIQMVNPITGQPEVLKDTYGIFRDTDGQYLGHVGKEYTPIQNQYAFDFVDALLESTGAHYESAGSLGRGERIWCLARLPHNIVINGTADVTASYLLFTNAHNGSASGTAKLCNERVVCENTLNYALNEKTASLMLRHTTQIQRRMEEAKAMMQGAIVDAKMLEHKLNTLAERQMTKDTMLEVLAMLFPVSQDGKAVTRRERIVMKVLELFESNDKNAIPEIRGTAYNLLNAVTEYTDHFRTGIRKGDDVNKARAASALFGSGDELKTRALNVITKVTVANPTRGMRLSVPAPSTQVQVLEVEPEAAPTEAEAPLSNTLQSVIDATVDRILVQ